LVKNILKILIPSESGLRCKYGDSLISKDRVKFMCKLLERCKDLKGDVIELGVFRGGSLIKMAKKLYYIHSGKDIYGLDTFEGLPYTDKGTKHKKGLMKNTNFNKVHNLILDQGLFNILLKKGTFKDSFSTLQYNKFCFVHMDCDLYKSHVESLEFILPRLTKNGIIFFDDYNSTTAIKVNAAVHKFINKEQLVILPGKQAYYVK